MARGYCTGTVDRECLSHSRKFYQAALIQKTHLVPRALASLFTDSETMAAFVVQERRGLLELGSSLGAVHPPGKQVPRICDSGHSARDLKPRTDSEPTS